LPWAVIVLFLLFQIVSPLLGGLFYSLKSQQSSPDKSHTIFEFRSGSEGAGHAPYGISLSLSAKSNIKHPDEGYVVFAGYCKEPLAYSWQGNRKIIVNCQSRRKEPVRTQAVRAYGIAIEVKAE
jgi:hypothetical protein